MKTAYELQMAAPDDQVVRCKIAMAAILEGKWKDAAAHYRNAAAEGYTSWHKEAGEMSAHCAEKAGQKMSDEERAIAANTAITPFFGISSLFEFWNLNWPLLNCSAACMT